MAGTPKCQLRSCLMEQTKPGSDDKGRRQEEGLGGDRVLRCLALQGLFSQVLWDLPIVPWRKGPVTTHCEGNSDHLAGEP